MKSWVAPARRSRRKRGPDSQYIFVLAGSGWVFCGALVLGLSTSTTHEITACLLISFGVIFFGVAVLLGQMRTLGESWRYVPPAADPPPVPVGYSISIEEAIDDVRTAVRFGERQAWIQSFDEIRSELDTNSYMPSSYGQGSYLPSSLVPGSLVQSAVIPSAAFPSGLVSSALVPSPFVASQFVASPFENLYEATPPPSLVVNQLVASPLVAGALNTSPLDDLIQDRFAYIQRGFLPTAAPTSMEVVEENGQHYWVPSQTG